MIYHAKSLGPGHIPVMVKSFQHLSFSITKRSWQEVMNECESTSSG